MKDDQPIEEIGHYICGQLSRPDGERTQPVFNPATGKHTGDVSLATPATVDAAVAAAKAAFPAWADTPPIRRARIMNRFLALVRQMVFAYFSEAEGGEGIGGGVVLHGGNHLVLLHVLVNLGYF